MTVSRSRSRSRTPRDSGPRKAELEAYAWHFDMIHDEARLSAFHGAFARLPKKALQGIALDIGCGTGVLGMCLLRERPELSRVIAFEADAALARVAEENAAKNRLEGQLSVRAVRSTAVSSLADADTVEATSPRASLLVAEILDAGLLGEDCLPTLRHAAGSLLCSDYFAVPAAADICACGVESSTLRSLAMRAGHLVGARGFCSRCRRCKSA